MAKRSKDAERHAKRLARDFVKAHRKGKTNGAKKKRKHRILGKDPSWARRRRQVVHINPNSTEAMKQRLEKLQNRDDMELVKQSHHEGANQTTYIFEPLRTTHAN